MGTNLSEAPLRSLGCPRPGKPYGVTGTGELSSEVRISYRKQSPQKFASRVSVAVIHSPR